MTTENISTVTHSITLTTGMFDLLKEQIKTKKLTKFNEDKLVKELRNAKQVLRNQLPQGIVDVNTKVTLLDLELNEEVEYSFVPHEKARLKHKTTSILSPIGVAIIGYLEGAEVTWQLEGAVKKFLIKSVARI